MKLSALGVALGLVAAACGGDSDDGRAGSVDSVDIELRLGGSSVGTIDVQGTSIDIVVVVPDGFRRGDVAPVLLALPPGGQSLDLTESVMAGVYETEAVARGWVVVSPAAPEGVLFFDGSESLIPGLLDAVETIAAPEGERFHVAGISNGGISAFRVAGADPDRFASLVVFPGFPRSEADTAALAGLVDIPVRMFLGGTDAGWIAPMETAAAEIEGLGGDVVLEIFPGEGHIIGSLNDGVRVFDELDAARSAASRP